jgi:hypothetical protein
MNTLNSLINRYLSQLFLGLALLIFSCSMTKAEEPAPYAPYFNPVKGFKPAQRSLADIFLQLAGSLEHFGTPEPYIRHVLAEHERIDAKHHAAGGKGSSRPSYLTDEYVNNLITNWNKIVTPLKLDAFCREAGRNIRYAILGSKNMAPAELAMFEQNLSETEGKTYLALLAKPYFQKQDFPAMAAFYAKIFDKLTETGKDQISRRTWLGTKPAEIREKELAEPAKGTALVRLINEQQDKTAAFIDNNDSPKANADTLQATLIEALKLDRELDLPKDLKTFEAEPLIYSHKIRVEYMRRVISVREQIKPEEQAIIVEKAMRLMLENLLVLAQSEFEAGLYEKMTNSDGN